MGDTYAPQRAQRDADAPHSWLSQERQCLLRDLWVKIRETLSKPGHLHSRQGGTAFVDLLGIAVCGLLDLKQPGCLRESFQGFPGQAVLQILIFKPFF